jgi:hypothetical protein
MIAVAVIAFAAGVLVGFFGVPLFIISETEKKK